MCSGVAHGIMLAVAGLITGADDAAASALPFRVGARPEVAVFRFHAAGWHSGADAWGENHYLNSVVMAGASVRLVDQPSDVRSTDLCVLWFHNMTIGDDESLIGEAIEAARAVMVPFIVDAADQIPPASNLTRFTRELGADLALFSGTKDLRGPTPSGLAVGSAAMAKVMLANLAPKPGVGRVSKVGRSQLHGLLAAIEESTSRDESARFDSWLTQVRAWKTRLSQPGLGVSLTVTQLGHCGQAVPRLIVQLQCQRRECRDKVVSDLWTGTPRVAVLVEPRGSFALSPQFVELDEFAAVGDKVICALETHRIAQRCKREI